MPNDDSLSPNDLTLHLVALTTDRSLRDSTGTFLTQGIRNVRLAHERGHSFERVLFSKILLKSSVGRGVLRSLRDARVSSHHLSPERFRTFCLGQPASGLAAVVRQRILELDAVGPADSGEIWCTVDRVRSPGNFGCLLRTSTAVGAQGLILVGSDVDPYDPAVIRGSMGAIFGQRLVRVRHPELERWVKRHGVLVIGASSDGSVEYSKTRYRRPLLLALGDERKGLSRDQRRLCNRLVRIPMARGVDSINVSVAAGILLYEIHRQTQLERHKARSRTVERNGGRGRAPRS